MVGLAACDFGAVQTAAALDLDALGAHAHCTAHALLHCAAECDALFQLGSNVLGNQLCVGVRVLDFDDVERYRLAQHLLHFLAELFDVLAALADDDARASAGDEDLDSAVAALDLDGRNACCVQGLLQILTDVVVFHEKVAELIVLGEPAGIPIFNYADTKTVRINFLAHNLPPRLILSL